MAAVFGAGTLVATQLVDGSGNAIAATVQTPVMLGGCQDFSLGIKFDLKKLYGETQFPLYIARGKGSCDVKVKQAQVLGAILNNVVLGQTSAAGQTSAYIDRTGTTLAATTITIVPPSSGTYAYDLGVRYGTGVPLMRVAATPAKGQYAVNLTTGVYTFASAEAGSVIFVSYQYTLTSVQSPTSQSISIYNLDMGSQPEVKLDYYTRYQGKSLIITLDRAVPNGMQFATKLDDFTIPEIDFDCMSNTTTNRVGLISVYE